MHLVDARDAALRRPLAGALRRRTKLAQRARRRVVLGDHVLERGGDRQPLGASGIAGRQAERAPPASHAQLRARVREVLGDRPQSSLALLSSEPAQRLGAPLPGAWIRPSRAGVRCSARARAMHDDRDASVSRFAGHP